MTERRRYTLTDAQKAYFEQLAAQAPPLTPEQRRRLRPILRGTLVLRPAEAEARDEYCLVRQPRKPYSGLYVRERRCLSRIGS